jgi:hypothetical protein
MQSDLGRARARHLCLPMTLGQLVLQGVLEPLLHPSGDKATQEAPEQRDIASRIDLLGIDPHLDAAPSARRVRPSGDRQTMQRAG